MAVNIRHLYKSYGSQKVLEDIGMHINDGETACIMGVSGRGKTTLLRILMGLEKADSGEILGMEGLRKSAVFQEDRLCENLSAAANIRLVMTGKISQETLLKHFEAVGLPKTCMRQPAKELSGGMRRRVALLRALLAPWDILLMDEPFKGLDERTKSAVIDYTRELCMGKTVICVTHDANEASRLGAGQNIIL